MGVFNNDMVSVTYYITSYWKVHSDTARYQKGYNSVFDHDLACVCVFPGVLDDENVRAMMHGSNMVKVRSQRWQKSRSLRLLEDGVTVWCESTKSSRKAKAQQTCEYTMGDGRGGGRGPRRRGVDEGKGEVWGEKRERLDEGKRVGMRRGRENRGVGEERKEA